MDDTRRGSKPCYHSPSTCGGAVITGARTREIGIIATNSDGDPARRALLLSELGAGATERIIDPGEDVVRARLADPVTGDLRPGLWASDQPVVSTPGAGAGDDLEGKLDG